MFFSKHLAHSSLRSQKGECGSFFGLCPKNEPPFLFLASAAK
ncbi:MAG: hypothetical protein U5L45_10585 [Saprospiraceae bacterium]|nr:hypothetical protein [Saprospiraceae bacterium]